MALWAHNLPNPEKVAANSAEKRARHEKKNRERIAAGKRPKRYKRTFGEWLQYGLGEPPVVLDTQLVARSSEQISLYLLKEGYFENDVRHEIKYKGEKRARVHYYIKPGPVYTLRDITRKIPDPNLRFFAEEEAERSLLDPGQRFSVSRMDRERDQLLDRFKDEGYFDLTKEDIFFRVDSAIVGNVVDVVMGVHPLRKPDPMNADSTLELNHIRYRLNDITINRSHDPFDNFGAGQRQDLDTTYFKDYRIIGDRKLRIKPGIITQNVRFEKGEYFSRSQLQASYRSLNAMEIFNAVNIKFERIATDTIGQGMLNSQILLTPAKRQQLVFETRGTHNSGFFGTAGSVAYRNRNFLRGGEVFRFKVSGAVEAQQLLTGSSIVDETTSNLSDQGTVFNTIEVVPELSLTIPKFLFPIGRNRISKSAEPFTTLSLSYGFQLRPDFRRNMFKGIISYRWRESDFKTWIVSPIEVSLIKIVKSDDFQQRLDDLNDLFLNASYSDHLISALKVSYIFNNQILNRRSNTFYYRGNAETAGNTLRSIMSLSGLERDSLGSYRIADIRFAHYVRTDHDIRYYRRFSENSSLVMRLFGGVGIPLNNLEVLPFERSFFSGGANGIRAWQIQTLGPGGFQSVLSTFDRIGEMQLEFNIEYRQQVFGVLEGAIFADIGNIWLLQPDPVRPLGHFAIDRSFGELGLGVGLGARLNFDFFIIRFDLATQLHDPSLEPGERWAFQPKDDYNSRVDDYNANNPNQRTGYYSPRLNLNLGIGYPF